MRKFQNDLPLVSTGFSESLSIDFLRGVFARVVLLGVLDRRERLPEREPWIN